MKELFKDFQDSQIKSEVKAEQDQKKEIKLLSTIRKVPGLTLFEYNQRTGEVSKAKFKTDETLVLKSLSTNPEQLQKSSKVIVNESCIYFQALNEKTARKKVNRKQ